MYADYDYYVRAFHGKLKEDDYAPLAEKAEAYIDSKTDFILKDNGMPAEGSSLDTRLKKCACCIADEMHRIETGTNRVKTGESVGDLKVTYASANEKSSDQKLLSLINMFIPDLVKAVRWG